MPGADGSLITGLTFNRVFLLASNTLFKRNQLYANNHTLVVGDNNNHFGSYTPSNVIVTQNYVESNGSYRALWVASGCSNIIVTNNLFHSNNAGWQAIYAGSSMIFSNNVVYGIMRPTTPTSPIPTCTGAASPARVTPTATTSATARNSPPATATFRTRPSPACA
jgi:hypothetical protein